MICLITSKIDVILSFNEIVIFVQFYTINFFSNYYEKKRKTRNSLFTTPVAKPYRNLNTVLLFYQFGLDWKTQS